MTEIDLKSIADAINRDCGIDIDVSKLEGLKLTIDRNNDLHIIKQQQK